jgi:hypothetical protein
VSTLIILSLEVPRSHIQGAIRPQDLYRILQEVLAERSLEFIIAPFSACAQVSGHPIHVNATDFH